MIHSLRGYPLIAGFRHSAPRDEAALVAIAGSLIRMFLEHPEVQEFDINPVILYAKGGCVVDARIYTTDIQEPANPDEDRLAMPETLLKIGSVAVVGASQNPDKVGYAICRNMLGFSGNLYPVNPNNAAILGMTLYPSLTAIPWAGGCCSDRHTRSRRTCHYGRCGEEESPSRDYCLFGVPGDRACRKNTGRTSAFHGKELWNPGHGP